MDFDLLKQYKEFEELNEKIIPLRTEYNFLVNELPQKEKEFDKIKSNITNLKQNLILEQEQLEKDKQEFEINKQNILNDIEINKNKGLKELESKKKQLKMACDSLQDRINEYKKTLAGITSEINKNELYLSTIKEESQEYSKIIDKETKQIKIDRENLQNDINRHNELLINFNKQSKEFETKSKIFENDKKEIDIGNKRLIKLQTELQIKEKEIKDKEMDLKNREQEIIKQENQIKQDMKKSQELIAEVESREFAIQKKIVDFQEEKYRFLVIMKQREIKKTDLDKLDKDFTI